MSLIIKIPTSLLNDIFYPFECPPWDCASFTIDMVRDRINVKNFRAIQVPMGVPDLQKEHIMRIAYLTDSWINDGSDAPHVEVISDGVITIHDGWHRVCAAITRNDMYTYIDLSGNLDAAEDMLSIKIP